MRILLFFCLGVLAGNAQQPASVPVAGDPLYAPVATAGPESAHEKFMEYAIVTFGPRVLFTAAIPAAIRMANPPTRYAAEWRQGPEAFGRNYGNVVATRTSLETARYVTGALLHEDFRYRPSASHNALARTAHALAFTFVDKSDSGHDRLAVANFMAAGAAGFVGNLYLPPGFDNLSHAGTRTAVAFGGLAGQNLLREFAPDLVRLTHKLGLPFPRIPVAAWWVKRDKS